MNKKCFTIVNGRKYQTMAMSNFTMFEDCLIEGRYCVVENNISVSKIKEFSYFNDISVTAVMYTAR